MKSFLKSVGLAAGLAGLLWTAGCNAQTNGSMNGKTAYRIAGQEFEACECEAVCPCVFSNDATADQCRAILVYRIDKGGYGDVHLKGVAFAMVLTQSGKNLDASAGTWSGVLYIADRANEAQKKGVEAIVRDKFGGAFAELEVRSAPMTIHTAPERYELTMGDIAELKITAMKGANGKVPLIKNPPSPVVLPLLYCATAEVHTYDDGESRWSFPGRNAFYGPFEYTNR